MTINVLSLVYRMAKRKVNKILKNILNYFFIL